MRGVCGGGCSVCVCVCVRGVVCGGGRLSAMNALQSFVWDDILVFKLCQQASLNMCERVCVCVGVCASLRAH